VGDQVLTLTVSGMLWMRSLVMMDTQTRSLWSHLLGQAMDGPLKGTELEALPSELTTWKAWRDEHPKTSVLNMSRTHREFVRGFYRRPQDFVYGLSVKDRAYHVPFPVLQETPVLNLKLQGEMLLVTFDAETAAARLFSRVVGDRTLTFSNLPQGQMRDEETESVWNRNTGEALEGSLQGKKLEQQVGIASFLEAWRNFHPESRPVRPGAGD
jgi:hypothetical protein